MRNVLFVLSPLSPALLEGALCAQAAQTLKAKGAQRADLSTLPRYAYTTPARQHKEYAAPDFTYAARGLASLILRPVLGRSDVLDLSLIDKILPGYTTLSNVGAIFASKATPQANKSMDANDGRDIGLVFYLALHGRASGGAAYDHLVFPHLSARALGALNQFCPTARGTQLEGYGTSIDLAALRLHMDRLNKAAPAKAPHGNTCH